MEIKKKEAFIGEETRGSWSQIPRENGEWKEGEDFDSTFESFLLGF